MEPKTDTITIDSDNEEETPSTSKPATTKGLKITSVKSVIDSTDFLQSDPVTAEIDPSVDLDVAAFSSSILASLLEVDITEGSGDVKTHSSDSPGGSTTKKQPRKKTTNKPNPALIVLERQRMEEIKRNDAKLKMKAVVKLRRAEDDFEVARKWKAEIQKLGSDNPKESICDEGEIRSTENLDNIRNDKSDISDKAVFKDKPAEQEAEETDKPTTNQTTEQDKDITKSEDVVMSNDPHCTDIAEMEIKSNIKQSEEPMDITEETEQVQMGISKDAEHVEREKPSEEIIKRLENDELIGTPVDVSVPSECYMSKNTELEKRAIEPIDHEFEADKEIRKSDTVIVRSNENKTETDDAKSSKTESEASIINANDAKILVGDIDAGDNKTNERAVSEADNEDVTSRMSPIKPDSEQPKDTVSSPSKPQTCTSDSKNSKVNSTPSEPLAEVDTV